MSTDGSPVVVPRASQNGATESAAHEHLPPSDQPVSNDRTTSPRTPARLLARCVHATEDPRLRLGCLGGVLIALAVSLLAHSAWEGPLLVVGILMLLVAWLGNRLNVRLAVQLGAEGTAFELQAGVLPRDKDALQSPLASLTHAAPDGETVEGEAHTVEIDVAELRALIAATESLGRSAP